MREKKILEAEHISVSFRMYDRGLSQYDLHIISDLSVEVHEGEIMVIVGASGSGKSVLAHAILGILPGNAIVGGTIRYDGAILDNALRKKLVGSEIIMIPQSVTYLDPLMKVGKQVRGLTGTEAQQRAAFARYGLKEQVAAMYPHELSGGMTRRVLISTATITDAKLILADEPTPGLSADIAAETMRNFRELADEGRGILMITHDIDVALQVADRIAVFYDGRTVDVVERDAFIAGGDALKHPYTKALWAALPQNGFQNVDPEDFMGEVDA
ncbi:MAG: ABC transporter ATP-binding protein [Oscillospiraceae bacterium]|nr:ABC transporter ATP-binding protein [Oscillospiraceae bacterium]